MLNALAAAASGALLIALYPPFGYTYLAPLALVPLLVSLAREPRPWRRFLLGAICGWAYWAGICHWLYYVMNVHGHVAPAGSAALYLGFVVGKGLHVGAFAWLAGAALARPWAIPAVAAAWVAIEGTHAYLGFTWVMLGHAAAGMEAVARLAPFTGVMGMSFALAMMSTALALALLRRPKTHLAWVLAVPMLYLLPALPAPAAGTRTAHLVQTRISQEEIYAAPWTSARSAALLAEMAQLSRAAASPRGRPPELIVWPENPAPFYFYDDPQFRAFMETLARQERAHLLFGTVAFRGLIGREPLNSAVLLDPGGAEVARYDKINLVPFGEFVPWPFNALVKKITREAGDYVAGDRVVVAPAGAGRIGTFICYESAFGNDVRKFAAAGAGLLVNISNDAWFGRSGARDQHLLLARLRAMENRRWLLRATNTGLTAVIDPAGRVTGALPRDQAGVLVAQFDYVEGTTPYTRWGDWFWGAALAATVALKLWERLR